MMVCMHRPHALVARPAPLVHRLFAAAVVGTTLAVGVPVVLSVAAALEFAAQARKVAVQVVRRA